MVMNLIMKLGKIVAALLIAAAIIAFATWGITVAFGVSDTLLSNFLGPLNPSASGSTATVLDTATAVGDFDEALTGNLDVVTGFQ